LIIEDLSLEQYFYSFDKAEKRGNPGLYQSIKRTLLTLAEDPISPSLHSHKLKGYLEGVWACSVDFDNRILFEFVINHETGEDEIYLLTVGSHDEVY
jgi:mRNA-degrading endonuclease YafQ of YafQ-DinJ toxin-antitoxin module